MKIALIAPILFEHGLYTISPQLKVQGHCVKILFVPSLVESYGTILSEKAASAVKDFVSDAGLIGVNSFSEAFHGMARLVDDIKRSNKAPVIWGGIHAAISPSDCLRHADMICIGEGEEAMVELAGRMQDGRDIGYIKNLLYRSGKADPANVELRPPVDLNSLRGFDYDLDSQYILENGSIRNVKEADFKGAFLAFSSRGCPFRCSYCCNDFVLNMYKGYRYCRQRDMKLVLQDLAYIKNKFPSCRHIWFNEADFLAGKSEKDIESFSSRYKDEIGVSFSIWSNPASVSDGKIAALKSAGLQAINIGTIAGNNQAQKEIFNRNAMKELYKPCTEILHRYGISVEYDFILCNPYETDDDIVATIRLLTSLPKPFRTVIYSLTYFPGTELYKRAQRDGIIKGDGEVKSYTKAAYKTWLFPVNTYMNGVASLMRGITRRNSIGIVYYGLLPEFILKLLIKKPVIYFFNHLPFRYFIFKCVGTIILTGYSLWKKISVICSRTITRLVQKPANN